jgi:hypothetical protein
MGWLFTQEQTRKELISHLIATEENETTKWETIAHCVRGNVLWSVKQITKKDEFGNDLSSSRIIMCDLLRNEKGYGWGYKDMTENMYPFYFSCPTYYFKLASPCFIGESAKKWRKEVIDLSKKQKDNFQSVKENFSQALKTGERCVLDILNSTVEKVDVIAIKKNVIGVSPEGNRYRIPRKMIGNSRLVSQRI